MWYRRNQVGREGIADLRSEGRRGRRARRLRPAPVFLEERALLTSLSAVLDAYDSATAGVGVLDSLGAASIVNRALGSVDVPFVNQSLAGLAQLGLAAEVGPSLATVNSLLADLPGAPTDSTATWAQVQTALTDAGFSITVPWNQATSSGTLLEVSYTAEPGAIAPLSLNIDQDTPFPYLNDGFFANLSATAQITAPFTITLGVDIPSGQTQPMFFVLQDPDALSASVTSSIAANTIDADLDIGDLASVTATNSAEEQVLNVTGSLGFYSNPSSDPLDAGGKLRAGDFANSLGTAVQGNVNGTAQLAINFTAQLTDLPSIPWSGTFSEAIQDGALQSPTMSLQEPSVSSLLSSLGSSLFSLGDDIPVLGPLSSSLNQPLPLIGESIAQLTGLDSDLPTLPSLPSGFDGLDGSYPLAGGTLTVDVTPTSIDQFLRGQMVDLASWEDSGEVTLADYNLTVPIYSIGVPDIASAEIDAVFGLHASLDYHFGFGVDTDGVYLDAGTPSDPTLGLSFGVDAGLQGQVEVFGFPLAEVGGDVGFAIEPYVTLTAPPWAADPSKVYLSDLALFGSNPVSDMLDDLAAGIQGDLTGDAYASIDLFLFSISWNWGISIPVFNYERDPTWPAQGGGGGQAEQWSNVHNNNGVLTFTGTGGNNDISLTSGSGGAVTVNWTGGGNTSGHTSETFDGVNEFVYDGGSGNDTLTAGSGFDIPTRAVAGGGNDSFQFQDATGNDTLVGGGGSDTLAAGSGKDILMAGSGNDTLQGGSSSSSIDTIYGGSGSDSIVAGDGQESIYGGTGDDAITAATGSTGTYFIDGGSGSYTAQHPEVINLSGNTGSGDSIYGGSGGDNLIEGSTGGHDLIYGDGPGDTIHGGGGYDTIYGGAGSSPLQATNNVIYGGDLGHNLIYGGGGGDKLYGAYPGATYGGDTTIYGGSGNETLYGGDGQDLQPNTSGHWDAAGDNKDPGGNLLVAGKGNDVIYCDSTGPNTLGAGAGDDVLWAGGDALTGDADYLAAGTGLDSLYGGPSDDTFQLQFDPTGQQPDVIVGGTGTNSLVLKPDAVDSPQLINAVTSTTSTTLEVTDAAALAGANASNFVIQVDSEQMLVTKVSGDTLTVVRGYDGTTAATHAAGDGVVVETPTLVDKGPSLAAAVTTTSTSLTVNDLAALAPSSASGFIILVDGEQMLVTAISGNTLAVRRGYDGTAAAAHAAGAAVSLQAPTTLVVGAPTLTAAITSATATKLTVTNAMALAPTGDPDFVIQVNSEQMLVTAISGNTLTVQRGYDGTTAATHAAGASVVPTTSPLALGASATTITVADAALLDGGSTSGFIIQVDQEQMLVTNVSGNTLTVERGYDNTTASDHYAGAPVSVQPTLIGAVNATATTLNVTDAARFAPANGYDPVIQIDDELMLVTAVSGDTLTVVRGYDSSLPASHAAGAPIIPGGGPALDPRTTTIAVANAAALAPNGAADFVIRVDQEQMLVTSVNLAAGTLTVVRGYDGTTPSAHAAGAYVSLETPALPAPSDYKMVLTESAGNAFQATLSNLDTGDTLGQVDFDMPVGVPNLALEGGPGNNLLDVESSVTADVSIYGGPGHNTLMAGSGNDTLVAGSGTSVLYGGSGADVLYGGDEPQQDATPTLDPSGTWSERAGDTTDNSETITDLATTSGLTVGQIVSGAGIPAGSVISSILSATSIAISNPATATASAVTIAFGSSTPEGHDTLIAGSGDSELFAGSGGDVLIGGTAVLENGQYVLEPGAGRDLLEGGSGNDVLIAGPGSPGSVLMAGSGDDILVGQNDGSNIMVGSGGGNDLFLGYAGSNDIDASGTSGNDTLVGGTGFNSLFGGDGTDWIYDYPNQASWTQAIQQAAALNVQLASPIGTNPGGSSGGTLWTLLDSLETAPQGFTAADQTSLASSLSQEYEALGITSPTGAEVETQLYDEATQSTPQDGEELAGWLEEDPTAHNDLEQILLGLVENPAQGLSVNQRYLWINMLAADLQSLSGQETNVANQLAALANIEDTFIPGSETVAQFTVLTDDSDTLSKAEGVVSKLLGSPDAADSLQAGDGVDYVYGNPSLPTWMAGGEGQDTFYNFNDEDTVLGGKGADNTLMFQGDGTFTLKGDTTYTADGVDVDLTPPTGSAMSWLAGNVTVPNGENITGLQYIGVQTGNANGDTVDIDLPTLPGGNLKGFYVRAGGGNGDVIDAGPQGSTPAYDGPDTLLAGTGADTIIIGSATGVGSFYQGNSSSELEVIGSRPGGDTVSVAGDLLRVDGLNGDSEAGATTRGSDEITGLADALLLSVGETVVDSGVIPAGSKVTSIVSVNAITISQDATTTAASTPLTFGITFGTLKVIGGSGSNTNVNQFSSDGSIPHIIFQGGSGTNTLSATIPSGGTAELIGGSGNNTLSATVASGGTAELIGGGGANHMTASGGTTFLFGGGGANDMTVTGGTGTLLGGSGANTYNLSGSGTYAVTGSTGTNTFNVSGGTAAITGGAGNNQYNINGAGAYTLTGGAGANVLVIRCISSGDAIDLSQSGSTITVSGTIGGAHVSVTASNMSNPTTDSVEVMGSQSGDDTLDASGMTMGVSLIAQGYGNTLVGGAGPDILDGADGAGDYSNCGEDYLYAGNDSDRLYFSGPYSSYFGDGGNSLVYRAQPNDNIVVYQNGLLVNGQLEWADDNGWTYSYLTGTYYPFRQINGVSQINGISTVEIQDGTGTATGHIAQESEVPGYASYSYAQSATTLETYTFAAPTIWGSGGANYTYSFTVPISPVGYDETAIPGYSLNNASITSWTWGSWVYNGDVTSVNSSQWPYNPISISFTVSGSVGSGGFLGLFPSSGSINLWVTITGYLGTFQWITEDSTYGAWQDPPAGTWQSPPTLEIDPGVQVTNLTAEATGAEGAVVNYPTSGPDAFTTGGADPQTSGLTYSIPSGSTFPIGTTEVTATAADGDDRTSTSTFDVTVLPQNVSNDATEIAVIAAPSATVYGQPATFTAMVVNSSPGASPPTGTVTFKDGTTTLGTGTLSTSGGLTTASFKTSTLAVGTHSITAVYDSSTYNLVSTSAASDFKVSQDATTTAMTASPTATVYGQSVTFKATVAVSTPGAGKPTGTVTFKDGTTTLGTGALSTTNGVTTATFTTSALAAGVHSITAVYGGGPDDLTSTSAALSFTVSSADDLSILSGSVASSGALPPGSGSLPTLPGLVIVAASSASTLTEAPRIAGGTVDRPSAGRSANPAPSNSVMGDLAFIDLDAAGSNRPPTPSRGSTTSAGAGVVSIPSRSRLVPPTVLRVAWTDDAPDDGGPLHGADSTDKVHDLALSSLFVDED